jgi:hypothetical protein
MMLSVLGPGARGIAGVEDLTSLFREVFFKIYLKCHVRIHQAYERGYGRLDQRPDLRALYRRTRRNGGSARGTDPGSRAPRHQQKDS